MTAVARQLGEGMAVDKLAYNDPRLPSAAASPQAAPQPAKGSPLPSLTFTVRLPANVIQADLQLRQAKELRDRLQAALPAWQVEITRLPADGLHSQIIEGSATQAAGTVKAPTVDYKLSRKA